MEETSDLEKKTFLNELLGAAMLDGLIDQGLVDQFQTNVLRLDREGQKIRFTTLSGHMIAFWQIKNRKCCAFRAELANGHEVKGYFYGRGFSGMTHGGVFDRVFCN